MSTSVIRDLSQVRERLGIVKGIDPANRTVTGYASTGEIDRYGEIVSPSAFKYDLDRFLRERHLLAAGHQYVDSSGRPTIIGKITSARIDAKGLFISAQFDTDEISELWWQKFKSGTINSFSIGFIPVKWEDAEQTVNGKSIRVRTYTEVELLEISAVPIPANRESIVTAAGDGAAYARRLDSLQAELSDLHQYVQRGMNQILGQVGLLARNLAGTGSISSPAPEVQHRSTNDSREDEEEQAPATRNIGDLRKSLIG